jgi:uncharacterized repeat protein (TIGR04138 family)
MEEKESFYAAVEQICSQDNRYKPDAYEFILQALHFTQNKLKKEGHVSGIELSQGIRDFVVEQYGPMAKTVLNHWGIAKTEDFGNIVFNLIDKKLLSKDENDSLEDFKSIYDFEAAFANILSDMVKNIE